MARLSAEIGWYSSWMRRTWPSPPFPGSWPRPPRSTLLAILATLAAWQLYAGWRLGRIELTTDGPPLVLQVLDESGEEPIGEPVDLVKKTTLSLPDGDYRVRAIAVGRLGRTFRLAVNRGETIAHDLSLDEGRLLGGEPGPLTGMQEKPQEQPMPFAGLTVALELAPGKADLVEWTGEALIRRDGDGQTGLGHLAAPVSLRSGA